jgi:hypothetical protein
LTEYNIQIWNQYPSISHEMILYVVNFYCWSIKLSLRWFNSWYGFEWATFVKLGSCHKLSKAN